MTQDIARPEGFADSFGRPFLLDEGLVDGAGAGPRPGTGPSPRQSLRQTLRDGEAASLSDRDMLRLLLAFAQPGKAPDGASPDAAPHPAPHPAAALAAHLATRFGSFAGVLAAPLQELRGVPGLGPHGLAAIRLIHAAALRLARAQMRDVPVLTDWDRLTGYLSAVLAREKIEQFHILFLDGGGRLIADEAQARGTVNHTPVYPREVVRRALELQAHGVILVHNHPSGDPTPSREDLDMTRQVTDAAAVLGITVQDHVIVGNGRWTSFRRDGLL